MRPASLNTATTTRPAGRYAQPVDEVLYAFGGANRVWRGQTAVKVFVIWIVSRGISIGSRLDCRFDRKSYFRTNLHSPPLSAGVPL